MRRLRAAIAALLVVGSSAERASADEPPSSQLNWRGSTEVGAYQDTLAVSVLTPSVGLAVESPTAGYNLAGRYLVDIVTAASPDIVATASPRWTEVRHAGPDPGRG